MKGRFNWAWLHLPKQDSAVSEVTPSTRSGLMGCANPEPRGRSFNRHLRRIALVLACCLMLEIPLAVSPAAASATVGACPIAKWNDSNGLSGGCTCWAAMRVAETSGRAIPWSGDGGKWWGNATWPKDPEQPRRYAIAAFGTHVAFVESVNPRETSWTLLGYTYVTGKSTPYYRNQQRYDVVLSEVDYYNKTRGVYSETMASFRQYYTLGSPITGQRIGGESWGTPRNLPVASSYGGLRGFIFP